jgi:hypothetical protein
LTTIGLI